MLLLSYVCLFLFVCLCYRCGNGGAKQHEICGNETILWRLFSFGRICAKAISRFALCKVRRIARFTGLRDLIALLAALPASILGAEFLTFVLRIAKTRSPLRTAGIVLGWAKTPR